MGVETFEGARVAQPAYAGAGAAAQVAAAGVTSAAPQSAARGVQPVAAASLGAVAQPVAAASTAAATPLGAGAAPAVATTAAAGQLGADGVVAGGEGRDGGAFATFLNVITWILVLVVVVMMILTLCSAQATGGTVQNVAGYSMFIVESDSMSATDFSAGDAIVTKQVDPTTLGVGDIITFASCDTASYGETVTHKIREVTTDSAGNPGFVTYGTTTGADDSAVVTYGQIIGQYQFAIPGLGNFFVFLKTVPGYFLCIFAPFFILIVLQGANTLKLYSRYRREVAQERAAEAAARAAAAGVGVGVGGGAGAADGEGVPGAAALAEARAGIAAQQAQAAAAEAAAAQAENARLLEEIKSLRAQVAAGEGAGAGANAGV